MPVPLTLVLALTSVAARTLHTRRTHPIAPNPTVLLCEHIWWLEDEVEYILENEWHCDHDEEPEKYMLESIEFFAMRLWKGEQVTASKMCRFRQTISCECGGTRQALISLAVSY